MKGKYDQSIYGLSSFSEDVWVVNAADFSSSGGWSSFNQSGSFNQTKDGEIETLLITYTSDSSPNSYYSWNEMLIWNNDIDRQLQVTFDVWVDSTNFSATGVAWSAIGTSSNNGYIVPTPDTWVSYDSGIIVSDTNIFHLRNCRAGGAKPLAGSNGDRFWVKNLVITYSLRETL